MLKTKLCYIVHEAVVYFRTYSKGDLESAVKYLEMYVSVAEKAGLKKSLAKACSAVGSMYSTLVSICTSIYVCVCAHMYTVQSCLSLCISHLLSTE